MRYVVQFVMSRVSIAAAILSRVSATPSVRGRVKDLGPLGRPDRRGLRSLRREYEPFFLNSLDLDMKGPRPTPTAIKKALGNPGRRPLNRSESKSDQEIPPAPKHLSQKARKTWDRVSVILNDMGVLTIADGIALEMLCEAYADYLLARDELEAFGSNFYETVNAQGGVMHRAHPAVAVMQDADRRIRAWLSEFGITPSARSRGKIDPPAEPDPADRYFD
jgi:P27 family predicted phage terminase small subunit